MKQKQGKQAYQLNKEQRILALYQAGITNCSSIWRRIKNQVKCSLRNVQQIVKNIKENKPITRKVRKDKGTSSLSIFNKKISKYIKHNNQIDSYLIKMKFKLVVAQRTFREFIQKKKQQNIQDIHNNSFLQNSKQRIGLFLLRSIKGITQSQLYLMMSALFKLIVFLPKLTLSKVQKNMDSSLKIHKNCMLGVLLLQWVKLISIYLKKIQMEIYIEIFILTKNLFPFVTKNFKKKIPNLYSDKDPKHMAKSTLNLIQKNKINRILDWPVNSPDLNPIKNVWSLIKRNVSKNFPKNVKQLQKLIKKEWESLSQQTISNLINSWEDRLKEIIQNKGNKISY